MSRLARFAPGITCTVIAWLCAFAPAVAQEFAPAVAQETSTRQAPAHISLVEGTAVLERDGEVETSPGSMPLLAGDRVRTRAGRVEVLFADSSTLHLDANTIVDFQSDEVVRLLEGRIRLNIPGPDRTISYRIDAPTGWVEVKAPGEYRVALAGGDRREVELAVVRGAADLVNENGATEVLAGERAFVAAGLAPSQPYVFNSAAWDAFDQWSEARRDQRLGISAQYLPAEVRPYAASLDSYGTWRHEPTYGYVWYPRVAVGWRPYYYGRWSHLRPFGWTWIGHDPWAWPTHHYGRWGFSAGVWFWIPGRHWGPAWVSWAYAPGYVSWCPLGWNNRAVFGFNTSHVFGGRRFDRWHGWTVVPHRRFGSGFVNVNVVNVTRIDVRTRRAFAVRDGAPHYTGRAIPRAQAPIRVAGTRGFAVPRDASGAAGSASRPNTDRTDSFRRRGSGGERLSGPGFPAPAREPRSVATPRAGERSNPSATSPRRMSPGTAEPERRGTARRAVPRTNERSATPAPEGATPSRRVAPRGERAPSAPARGSGSGAAAAPERSRSAPRATAPPSSAPAPSRGTSPRRVSPRGGGRSAPARGSGSSAAITAAPEGSRAVSRRNEPSGRAPRAYRNAPAPSPSYTAPAMPSRNRNDAPGRATGRTPNRPAYQAPSPRRASPGRSPRMSGPDRSGSDRGASRSRGSAGRAAAPSPAPAQRSAGSAPAPRGGEGSAAAPRSRSRGGQPSSGRAVSRRGGGGN